MSRANLKIGLLGAGYIADWHAQALRAVPGTTLAAVCDTSRPRAEALAARYGVPGVYGSLDELLAAGGLDTVHVLLPPEHHFAAAERLIDSGLDVLLEKPMCTTVEECDRLIELAKARGVRLGVGHNFLFSGPYERLKADLSAGRLGRPERVTITWARELPQLRAGPFDLWMLREPENILLEVGPHSVAQVLDLLGPLELAHIRGSSPVDLPGGGRFYRRWHVEGDAGPAAVTLEFAFAPAFAEHVIHVRGTAGSATADLERNTYVLRRAASSAPDVDRYRVAVAEARQLRAGARRGLTRYALGTLKLARDGKPYGASIAGALRGFYGPRPGPPDPRVGAELGRAAVRICAEIGRRADLPRPARAMVAAGLAGSPSTPPEVLVLGATGFIGREMVRQLVAAGRPVRILARSPGRLPDELRIPAVDVVPGDAGDPAALGRALEGIRRVVHLARATAKTWAGYQRDDVAVTERIAEACLERGITRLVYTGTIASYYAGARAGTITEATPADRRVARGSYYARAKALTEENLLRLHRERGLPVVIVRPGVVIGRGGSPYHWGVGMWAQEAACRLWGHGDHPLPFVLVEDVADGLIRALDAEGVDGESFNLVGPPVLSGRDYVAELSRAAGVAVDVAPTAPWRFYAADMAKWAAKVLVRHPDGRRVPSYREWESRTLRAPFDFGKARERLGWVPTSDRDEYIRRGIVLPATEYHS